MDLKNIENIKKLAYSKKIYPDDYNLQIRRAISLLSAKKNNPTVFGSSSLKSMLYASDIDLMEKLSFSEQKKRIPEIIKKIISDKDYGRLYQLGDIKIGTTQYGKLLLQNIGTYENNKIINYNSKNIKKILDEIPSEIIKNLKIPKIPDDKYINIELWVKLYYFIHSISVIRWTSDEILKGINKDGIKLNEAIETSELSKIDLYFFLNGRFVEITNFYYDDSQDDTNKEMINGLKLNLLKYVYTDDKNYLKALKRLNAVARLTANYKILDKLKFFLSGNIALLSSAKTDLETLIIIDAYGYNINKNKDLVTSHIGNIINKLSNIFVVDVSKKNKQINILQDEINTNKNFTKDILKQSETTAEDLNNIINQLTKQFIKINNIKLIF
jgi:hypothetical protein